MPWEAGPRLRIAILEQSVHIGRFEILVLYVGEIGLDIGEVVVDTVVLCIYGPARSAKGAIIDPVLTPVTNLKTGIVPLSAQPHNSPAPNAPSSPPPEIASSWAGANCPPPAAFRSRA